MTSIVVVSTAKDCPAAARCAASVLAQGAVHVFVAADSATARAASLHTFARVSPAGQVSNLVHEIGTLRPSAVVVWLDGDDELAPGAIERVRSEYENPDVWLTYGSFVTRECVKDYEWHTPFGLRYSRGSAGVRAQAWRASHLRTFRAGLFQAIPRPYLERSPGVYFDTCTDRAIMLPMLEMAGERYSVIQDVLCIYDRGHGSPAHEPADREQIHSMTPLPRLERAPW